MMHMRQLLVVQDHHITMSPKEKSGQLVRALRKAVTTCHSELATINEIGVVEEIVYPS